VVAYCVNHVIESLDGEMLPTQLTFDKFNESSK